MKMLRCLVCLFALAVIACGGSSPTVASPQPVPVPIIAPDPALFDATFNAQLVHDAYDHPNTVKPAALLPSSPSIYMQSDGLTPETLSALEAEARTVVPLLSGGTRTVAAFESGPGTRPIALGWIMVDLVTDVTDPNCGWTTTGALAGHIWLNLAHPAVCTRPLAHVLGHEIGHALGFYHVADPACLMSTLRPLRHDGLPCAAERYHAGLAYQTNGAYVAGEDTGLRRDVAGHRSYLTGE